MANDKVLEVTQDTFESSVLNAKLPVLVDFWASWCGPCRMIAPILDQVAEEFDGKAIVAKINVDDNPDLARQYDIMTIPTLITFKNGDIVETSGPASKGDIEEMINKLL